MIYTIKYSVEQYPSPNCRDKYCLMGRAYDGTGQLVREDSLSGPFEKQSLETWISQHFDMAEKKMESGEQWRGQRLP